MQQVNLLVGRALTCIYYIRYIYVCADKFWPIGWGRILGAKQYESERRPHPGRMAATTPGQTAATSGQTDESTISS